MTHWYSYVIDYWYYSVPIAIFGLWLLALIARYRLTLMVLPTSTPPQSWGSTSSRKAVVYYRTKDGRADYGFRFERHGVGYRIYVTRQPMYSGRETDMHSTHRLSDGQGHYVCWSGHLATEDEARNVAALWADNTQRYIATGCSF